MDRRQFVQTTTAGMALAAAPRAWSSQDTNGRLMIVLLRGGMDGLCAVPPTDDVDYVRTRPSTAVLKGLPLAAGFSLHPSLSGLHDMWQANQLAVVHSTGFKYTGRSHFEGQDIMQSGVAKPYASSSGWVGRAMSAAQTTGGVSISIPMPLILRGNPNATTQFPNWMPTLRKGTAQALEQLWESDDALQPYASSIARDNLAEQRAGMHKEAFLNARSLEGLAKLASAQMKRDDGPRVGLIDVRNGFDTHAGQGAERGAHAQRLKDLNRLVTGFARGMGEQWQNSLLVTVTEFGRTAAENGTNGTDHGVGSCCFLAGGLVGQSKVYADWRGLKKEQLFEARDLPATIDVAAVYAKVLERVFGLSPATIQASIMAYDPSPHLAGLLNLG